jgi:hypothetical protein
MHRIQPYSNPQLKILNSSICTSVPLGTYLNEHLRPLCSFLLTHVASLPLKELLAKINN